MLLPIGKINGFARTYGKFLLIIAGNSFAWRADGSLGFWAGENDCCWTQGQYTGISWGFLSSGSVGEWFYHIKKIPLRIMQNIFSSWWLWLFSTFIKVLELPCKALCDSAFLVQNLLCCMSVLAADFFCVFVRLPYRHTWALSCATLHD